MTEVISVTRRIDGSFRAVHRQHGWKTTGVTRAEALNSMTARMREYEFGEDDDDFETVDDSVYSITSTLVESDE